MANEIFISYSRKDFDKVRQIKESIDKELGIDCWMDLDGIESGDQFKNVIISAINNHNIILFIMTENSMYSKWALKELSFAEKKSKRIILVDLDHSPMTDDFMFEYGDKDNIIWDNKIQHDKLIKNLKKWIGNTPCPQVKSNGEDLLYRILGDNGKWGLGNKRGEIIIPYQYDYIDSFFDNGFAIVINNDKLGLIDDKGKIIVPCEWQEIETFHDGLAMVEDENFMNGFVDLSGKLVIPCVWDAWNTFSEGLCSVYDEDQNLGFIDKTGNLVIPFQNIQTPFCPEFHNGLCLVTKNDKMGAIDKTGNIVIPCVYKEILLVSDGCLAVIDERNKWRLLDSKGRMLVQCEWDDISFSSYNKSVIGFKIEQDKWGLFDNKGNLINNNYWSGVYVCKDMIKVKDDKNKWGLVDNAGNLIISCQWEDVFPFNENCAPVKNEQNKWGFIDKTGRLIIPCKWVEVRPFLGGYAAVKAENQKWGYIDKNGHLICPCQWDHAGDFDEDGLANVTNDFFVGYISNQGGFVWKWPKETDDTESSTYNNNETTTLSDNEIIESMEDLLKTGLTVTFPLKGTGMVPTIKNGESAIFVRRKYYQVNDIVMTKIDNEYYKVVRIIKIEGDGQIIVKSDALSNAECRKSHIDSIVGRVEMIVDKDGNKRNPYSFKNEITRKIISIIS